MEEVRFKFLERKPIAFSEGYSRFTIVTSVPFTKQVLGTSLQKKSQATSSRDCDSPADQNSKLTNC
jgi:hypothetical protein